jgi:hypothetical protein
VEELERIFQGDQSGPPPGESLLDRKHIPKQLDEPHLDQFFFFFSFIFAAVA